MSSLTQAQLFERIASITNPERRARAIWAWKVAYGGRTSEDSGAKRDIDHRRSFLGDPWKYARDIFGYRLYPDLERLLEACTKHNRLIVPAANDVGKTFTFSLWATYRYDVVAAMPDVDAGLEQQGCLILLAGPDEDLVYATNYVAMVKHFERAVRRGFGMPGTWSQKSVTMRAGPEWYVEAVCPAPKVGEEIAHGASGRHHRGNLLAMIEEGQAVREAVWRALDGSASGEHDQIICPLNPDIPNGPARDRAQSGEWYVQHISAFDHPNVTGRRVILPGAISHGALERAIRDQCKDLGTAAKRAPDPKFHDFAYALPPKNPTGLEPQPRPDGRGHAEGELRIFRPNNLFTAQRIGQWPRGSTAHLFTAEMLQESAARYETGEDPNRPPDCVGLDPARYGDDAVATPRWGKSGEEVLRAYLVEAEKGEAEALAFRANPENRIRIGAGVVMPKGDGHELAHAVTLDFPSSPFVVDQGGGDSVIDQLRNVLERDVLEIAFGGAPWEPVGGERLAVDMRAAMYIRWAELLAYGLLDGPMPSKLRQDLLAHYVEKLVYRPTDVKTGNGWQKEKRAHARVVDKPTIKKKTGRSPDYGDSGALSLVEPATSTGRYRGAPLVMSS